MTKWPGTGGVPLLVEGGSRPDSLSLVLYCTCIMARGGIHGEIEHEHKGNPEGKARGNSRGLRLYLTVYPFLSHNTDILNSYISFSFTKKVDIEI